jgi:hypothetical protein
MRTQHPSWQHLCQQEFLTITSFSLIAPGDLGRELLPVVTREEADFLTGGRAPLHKSFVSTGPKPGLNERSATTRVGLAPKQDFWCKPVGDDGSSEFRRPLFV